MVLVGLFSSAFTLILKAFIDILTEGEKNKRELYKLMFQRKTDAVENAMSWYQESFDCLSAMRLACIELRNNLNTVDYSRFLISSQKAMKVSEEAPTRLNPLYLYYSPSEIEQNYETTTSLYYISSAQKEIYDIGQKILGLSENGILPESKEIKELMHQAQPIFDGLIRAIDVQIKTIVEIQKRLRVEYQDYSFKHNKSFLEKGI